MKPRDVFKIIVGTVGLLGFGYGVLYLIDGILCAMGLFQPLHSLPGYYAARGALEMFIGLLFMKGIPPFVDLVFPLQEASPPKEQEHPETDEASEGLHCVSCQAPISKDAKLCPKCGYAQPR